MAVSTPNFGWPVPEKPDPATIPQDILNLAIPIDAVVQQLADRVEAREKVFAVHDSDGTYSFANGLGEPLPVAHTADGAWQVIG